MTHIVTLFSSVTSDTPEVVDLIPEIISYQKNTAHQELVRIVREEPDKERRNQLKKNLPCFALGAILVGGGAAKHIKERTDILFLDFDCGDQIIAKRTKEILIECLTGTAIYIGLSASGLGVHLFLQVTDRDNKIEHWNAFINNYVTPMDLPFDFTVKDFDTRKTYIGCDLEAYINTGEITLFGAKDNKIYEESKEAKPISKLEYVPNNPEKNLQVLIKKAAEDQMDFTEGRRNAFIVYIAYRANRMGIPLEFVEAELERLYNLSNFPDHLKTLRYIYDTKSDQFGQVIPKNIKVKDDILWVDSIEAHLKTEYDFRYNTVLNRLEYSKKGANQFKMMTDYFENSLLLDLWRNDIKCGITHVLAILNSHFSTPYNPFEDYFNNLPPWDGVDHIAKLASTIKTDNQDEFWNKAFKKWLVAMVASAIEDHIINHQVLVFVGRQGLGKTTWILNLVPKELKNYSFTGTINPDNKDALVTISECILVNLDELENLNKAELGSLKDLITKPFVRLRRAYGHNNERYPRRASFSGSVNRETFLNDPTGTRRFLCFDVLEIDYHTSIDHDLVYAQALHLFRNGFKFFFDKEEIDEINAMNEKYSVMTLEEEVLLSYFEPDNRKEAELYLTASQVTKHLEWAKDLKTTGATHNYIGRALRKNEFRRLKKDGVWKYALKVKPSEKRDESNIVTIDL